MIYTLDDIEKIKKQNNNYEIDDTIIENIKIIAEMVGANNYVKTPIFKNNNKFKKFQNTNVTSTINNVIKQIKLILNKLSFDNYKTHVNSIMSIIDNNIEMKENIYIVIFEETIKNKINQLVFVNLIKLLHNNYDWMIILYNKCIEQQYNKIVNFNHCSSDNYDLFCKINNENEERKLFLNFLLLLFNENMIDGIIINQYIDKFIYYFYEYLNTDKYYIIEQICLCLYLLLVPFYNHLNEDIKVKVNKLIELISNSNNTSYIGLTNKSIFKILDLKENIYK